MADKTVADLPALQAVSDETLIPVYQPGAANPAQKMKGQIFRQWAEACVTPYSNAARADAALAEAARNDAQNAKTAAQSALSGVQTAIKNIPAGSTPIVNDLTTGGVSMALSAEMGKKLLPLDGSKSMTGQLKSPNGIAVNKLRVEDWGSGEALIRFYDRNGNGCRYISIWDKKKTASLKAALLFGEEINGVYETHQILHTGNKPSASYTGNGDATARTINTGGIGSVAFVYNSDSAYTLVIALSFGAFVLKDATAPKFLQWSECHFANGVLTVASTNAALNTNGKSYSYKVL